MKTTITSLSIALCLALGAATPALADRSDLRGYYRPAPRHYSHGDYRPAPPRYDHGCVFRAIVTGDFAEA